jgi:hypothetical protein
MVFMTGVILGVVRIVLGSAIPNPRAFYSYSFSHYTVRTCALFLSQADAFGCAE